MSQAIVAYRPRCLKEGIFWEGEVDYGSVTYSGEEGGYIPEGGVDSGSVAYLGGLLGGRDGFWEEGIDLGPSG